jgi:superfamily II DNA helicase RecQ
MQLTLITVAFEPERGGFPREPLAEIDGEIVSVVEHFFHHGGTPHLLLVVHHRASAPARSARPASASPRAELSADERELFDRLRAWRNGRAEVEGVPPYVLLTNRQLADIARLRPASLAALREVNGIGEAKAGRFGRDLVGIVHAAMGARPDAHGGPAPAAGPG